MGFGILLIGYALYLNTIVPVYTIPVSAVVTGFGLRKLKIWNSGFRGAWRVDLVLAAAGLAAAGLAAARTFGAAIPDALSAFVSAGLALLVLLFHFYLGSGIISLANEVGLPKLAGRAFFFRTAACIYWFLYAFLCLDLGEGFAPVVARLSVPVIVVGVAVALVGLAILFACYTDIGMPDEGNAPEKPGFLARMKKKSQEEDGKDDK